jgi:hypothetical protein
MSARAIRLLALGFIAAPWGFAGCREVPRAQEAPVPQGPAQPRQVPRAPVLLPARASGVAELPLGPRPGWTGSYGQGEWYDHVTLRIRPDDFSFTRFTCMGSERLNHGPLRVEGDQLVLTCALPNERAPFCPERLWIVPWGAFVCLVEDASLQRFVTLSSDGATNARALADVAWVGWAPGELPTGRPDLPPGARTRLVARPFEATVVAVDAPVVEQRLGARCRTIDATLDVGWWDGAYAGMRLLLQPPGARGPADGRLAGVTELWGEGCVVRMLDEGGEPVPAVGWKAIHDP